MELKADLEHLQAWKSEDASKDYARVGHDGQITPFRKLLEAERSKFSAKQRS